MKFNLSKSKYKKTEGYFTNVNKIESLHQFIEEVEGIRKDWDLEPGDIWFRGVYKETYKLIPSIYRRKVWKYDSGVEADTFSEFIRRAKSSIKINRDLSNWEWYQLMQHHGFPTRLLDWTEGATIALYFAVNNFDFVKSPCIWILDPYWLNLISVEEDEVFYTDPEGEKEKAIVNAYIEDRKDLPDLPLAIVPPYIDERIVSQKSCFTIHGRKHHGFKKITNDEKSPRLIKLRVESEFKKNIKDALITSGVTESTLFPDLEGIARELKYEYGMK